MKVIIIDDSPATDDLVDKLIESTIMGLKSAEPIDVEVIGLKDEDLAFCTACGRCMANDGLPLGICPFDEDDAMKDHLLSMREADRIILATRLSLGTVSALMKRFLERCAPLSYNSRRGRLPRVKKRKGKFGGIIIVHTFFPVLNRLIGKTRGPQAMLKLVLRAAGCDKVRALSIRLPRLPPYRADRARGRAFNLGLKLAKAWRKQRP